MRRCLQYIGHHMDVTSDGLHCMSTSKCTLKQLYMQSQFSVCKMVLLPLESVPSDKEILLLTFVVHTPVSYGLLSRCRLNNP